MRVLAGKEKKCFKKKNGKKENDKYKCQQAHYNFSLQIAKMNETSGADSFVSTALT